jgi:hypothetical protein
LFPLRIGIHCCNGAFSMRPPDAIRRKVDPLFVEVSEIVNVPAVS